MQSSKLDHTISYANQQQGIGPSTNALKGVATHVVSFTGRKKQDSREQNLISSRQRHVVSMPIFFINFFKFKWLCKACALHIIILYWGKWENICYLQVIHLPSLIFLITLITNHWKIFTVQTEKLCHTIASWEYSSFWVSNLQYRKWHFNPGSSGKRASVATVERQSIDRD